MLTLQVACVTLNRHPTEFKDAHDLAEGDDGAKSRPSTTQNRVSLNGKSYCDFEDCIGSVHKELDSAEKFRSRWLRRVVEAAMKVPDKIKVIDIMHAVSSRVQDAAIRFPCWPSGRSRFTFPKSLCRSSGAHGCLVIGVTTVGSHDATSLDQSAAI